MQIIINPPELANIDDYACWRGTLDAIRDTYSETLFNFNSEVARELRSLYELAYEMELQGGAFEAECDLEVDGVIHSYDDNSGWGKIYSDQFTGLLDFCYRELTWDDFVELGSHVTVRFYIQSNSKIKIRNIKRTE